MSRHYWRACAREAGFSFVELLVTIVIAGIAFAAMVPVFVQATEKNSADTLRLQAANVAQDRIEKIRQLPYSEIAADPGDRSDNQEDPNLYDPKFASEQFGDEEPLQTGSGARIIHVDYQVALYPAAATGLASQYKVVTVTATWDAPPSPVKPVVLQTIVYRQYAGPPLDAFYTTPAIADNGVLGDSSLTYVTLTAHVDMTGGAEPGSVQFAVAAFGGQTIASKLVSITDTNPALGYWYDEGDATFSWTWDCSTAANRVYDFQATAYSTDEYAGNTMHLYPSIDHTVLPAPPGDVTAVGGNGSVALTWGVSSASGLTGYDIFRSNSPALASFGDTPIATVNQSTTTWTDPTALNGETYYYAVRAVTGSGPSTVYSTLTVSNPAYPDDSGDGTPPTAPTSLVATAAPAASTITLTWGASLDAGGLLHYEIYRSADGVTWDTSPLATWPNLTSLSYSDATAGWASTWYYRVRAVDLALNTGTWSNVAHAVTIAQPRHDLQISVNPGKDNDCYVWVLDPNLQHYYTTAGVDNGTTAPNPGAYIAQAGTVVFSDLPDGAYTVFASKSATLTTGATTYGVTVQAPYGSLKNVKP